MRKRLRKKKRLKEFRQYGFVLGCWLHDESGNVIIDWAEDCLWPLLRRRQWARQTGGPLPRFLFVCEDRFGTMTEAARDELATELLQHPQVERCQVSRLLDANHGSYPGKLKDICTIRRPPA